MPQSFKSILKELDVVVILGALLLVAAIFKASTFYNLSNLFTILELSAVLGIATLGEAMVLIVRGVDVSVGAVMGLAGTLSAFLIPDLRSPPRSSFLLSCAVSLGLEMAYWSKRAASRPSSPPSG